MAAFSDPEVDIVSGFDILVRVNGAGTRLAASNSLGLVSKCEYSPDSDSLAPVR